LDLLQKTPDFWKRTQKRLQTELGGVDRFLQEHFRVRWGIDRDLDRLAIEHNISRLKHILKNFPNDYRRYLAEETNPINPASRPGGPKNLAL